MPLSSMTNNERQKRYREKHREAIKKRQREWYQRNKEKVLAEQKEYYKQNPEKRKLAYTKYYKEHKEKCLKAGHDYRVKNGVKEKRRLWAIDNRQKPEVKDKIKANTTKYRQSENGKRVISEREKKRKPYFDKYRKTENRKATCANYRHKRRANMAITDITSVWLKDLKEKSKECPLCNKIMAKHGKYPDGKQLDHILPLAVGGEHKMNNVRYICSMCNLQRPKDGSDNLKLVI